MSGDAPDVTIPAVFMQKVDATYVRELLASEESVYILLTWIPKNTNSVDTEKQAKQVPSVDSDSSSVDSNSRTESDSQLFDSGQGSP